MLTQIAGSTHGFDVDDRWTKRVSLQSYAMALARTMHGVCSDIRFPPPHSREAPGNPCLNLTSPADGQRRSANIVGFLRNSRSARTVP